MHPVGMREGHSKPREARCKGFEVREEEGERRRCRQGRVRLRQEKSWQERGLMGSSERSFRSGSIRLCYSICSALARVCFFLAMTSSLLACGRQGNHLPFQSRWKGVSATMGNHSELSVKWATSKPSLRAAVQSAMPLPPRPHRSPPCSLHRSESW